MRKLFRRMFAAAVLCAATGFALAANTVTSVSKVTEAVTLSEDVDYVITSDTPFEGEGSVNITNTDHAVLILKQIRPSVTIKTWLANHVYIKGQQAVNGTNCQVKMYAHGTIIMPYASDIKPLTVYSEQNFSGTSVNSFGLENDGGFMNTLTTDKLNNQIRSFKLKRGYMVTFSTRPGGRGYSRCFIADTEDLEVASLPMVLDQRISSYRVFTWYDSQKKGVADYVDETANFALGSTWSYTWGTGRSLLPDAECVSNHIYEDWPSPAACGNVTYTCHMKTNNEPGNSADDHPQDVATVLGNWENLMRTGLRLCSESSHDGSWAHLRAFIDSIDARGWRCDLLDLHCYWPGSSFYNWKYYYDSYGGRPIWISEWVWGASWNQNGVFGLGDLSYEEKQARNAAELSSIIPSMNNSPYVERYAYWNSEADFSKVYQNGLTTSGRYYASVESGLGHNSKYDKIPTLPRQYSPSNLSVSYNSETKKVTLEWHDVNGEYNRSMAIEVKTPSSASWTELQTVTPQESEADYKVTIDGVDGYKYRIHVVDLKNVSRYTNEASAVNNALDYGQVVSVGDQQLYLGGNRLPNGSFDMGFLGWTSGTGEQIAAPYFQVVKTGGIDGGSYLQCYGNASTSLKTEPSCLWTTDILKKGTSYYVSAAGFNNNPSYQRITTSAIKNLELMQRIKLEAVTEWAKQGASFTTTTDTLLYIAMRAQEGKACLDNVMVCELFSTQEEALADALKWERKRVDLFRDYNTEYPQLTAEVETLAAAEDATAFTVREAISNALEAMGAIQQIEELQSNAELIVSMKLPDYENVSAALTRAESAQTALEYISAADALNSAINTIFKYSYNTSAIQSPSFSATTGWNTSAGTYKGGDQRTATQAGSTCWNAWWAIGASNTTATMAVNQDVKNLIHGLYAVECKATTQHLCETDQHAFLINSTQADTVLSPALPYGLLDLPQFKNSQKWQTLATPYVYVNDGDVIRIGFEGSKAGAADGSWMAYGDGSTAGDNREGWWCATDFKLRYIPMLCRAASNQWGTICLPDILTVPEGVTLYKIAGILADGSAICLEPETDDPVAGVPYIFHTESTEAVPFYESGSSVTVPRTNYNGMRGVFKSIIRYPVNSLVLNDGVWTTTTTTYAMTAYSGYIEKVENLKGLASWDGLTLPATGVDPSKITVGLNEIEEQTETVLSGVYNLYGQKVSPDGKGLLIRNGKLIFVK